VVRTQVYLKPTQHRALRRAAARQGVSMTELLRRLVDRYLARPSARPDFTKEEVMSFVGLGETGRSDISEQHDEALQEAFRGQALR
jgi:hypothetical protein